MKGVRARRWFLGAVIRLETDVDLACTACRPHPRDSSSRLSLDLCRARPNHCTPRHRRRVRPLRSPGTIRPRILMARNSRPRQPTSGSDHAIGYSSSRLRSRERTNRRRLRAPPLKLRTRPPRLLLPCLHSRRQPPLRLRPRPRRTEAHHRHLWKTAQLSSIHLTRVFRRCTRILSISRGSRSRPTASSDSSNSKRCREGQQKSSVVSQRS